VKALQCLLLTQSGHERGGIAAVQTDPRPLFRQSQIPDVINHIGVVLSFGAGDATPRSVIGFLHGGSADPNTNGPLVKPFREGLAQFGYLEGRNLVIEFRWAEASSVTELMLPIRFASKVSMLDGSSRGPSRRTCQFYKRRNLDS